MQEVVNNFCKTFIPPPNLKTSQWSDLFRYIPKGQSAEPGLWKTSRAPYLREIMDAADDYTIRHMVIMKSARIGITEALINIIFKRIDIDPCQILYMLPTGSLAEKFSKKQFTKSVEATPSIFDKMPPARQRDSDNTILEKNFFGGDISFIGSNSPSGMRMVSKELVILDDKDGFPPSAGIEGDPGALAKARGDNFWNFKLIEASSPTVKGISPIEFAFKQSDQRYYFVPCPFCNHYQRLVWAGVRWLNNNASSAIYECENCSRSILEKHKYAILNEGHYIATEDFSGTAGWHISQLYSLFRTWSAVVQDWLKMHKDPETLKVFLNTKLGELWEEQGEKVDFNDIYMRREAYDMIIPSKAVILTAAVDTQDDRIEILIKAWGRDEESWDLDHRIIYGDLSQLEIWNELDAILQDTYEHESGASMGISCSVIDTGGHYTDEVYRFVLPRQIRNVFGIKGSNLSNVPIVSRPTKTNKGNIRLYTVGVYAAKEIIASRLKLQETGVGYIHYPDRFDEEFFKQLTSEKKVPKYKAGFITHYEWVKTRARNEAFDLEVYSLAALRIICKNREYLNKLVDKGVGNVKSRTTSGRRVISRGN